MLDIQCVLALLSDTGSTYEHRREGYKNAGGDPNDARIELERQGFRRSASTQKYENNG